MGITDSRDRSALENASKDSDISSVEKASDSRKTPADETASASGGSSKSRSLSYKRGSRHLNVVLLYLAKIFWDKTDEEHGLSLKEITHILNEDYGLKIEEQTVYKNINLLMGREDKTDGFTLDPDLVMDIRLDKVEDKNEYRYHLQSHLFKQKGEMNDLIYAVNSYRVLAPDRRAYLISTLKDLTSEYEAKKLGIDSESDSSEGTRDNATERNLEAINDAMGRKKQLRFKYFRWTWEGKREYRIDDNTYCPEQENATVFSVSPWGPYYDNGKEYLIAYLNGRRQHYRVDKMVDVEVGEEPMAPDVPTDPEEFEQYTSQLFGMWSDDPTAVTLGFTEKSGSRGSMANVIIDRFRDPKIEKAEGNNSRYTAKVNAIVGPPFYGWIAGMKGKIWIIEPQEVRDGMKKFLNDNMQPYSFDPDTGSGDDSSGDSRKITLVADAGLKTIRGPFLYLKKKYLPDSGQTLYQVSAHLGPRFFRWLADQEGKVRVAGPEDLVKEIREYAGGILNACPAEEPEQQST